MTVTTNEKLELMIDAFSELIQINVSLWRVVYLLGEIVSLMVIFIVLPILFIKLLRWGINEMFSKN